MQTETSFKRGLRTMSIRSQRSRAYLDAALALTSVVPMLCFCVLMLSVFTDLLPDSILLRAGVGAAGMLSGAAGYVMLRVYPANLERLRDYLSRIAADDIPAQAQLLPGEQDFSDIEVYLNDIISALQKRIARLDEELSRTQRLLNTIKAQSTELVEAERQRVMLESLGAACHHIGQPTTVLSLYLTRLRDQSGVVIEEGELNACLKAVESISTILKKLMRVSEYRTVPYVMYRHEDGTPEDEQIQILDIEPGQARPDSVSGPA